MQAQAEGNVFSTHLLVNNFARDQGGGAGQPSLLCPGPARHDPTMRASARAFWINRAKPRFYCALSCMVPAERKLPRIVFPARATIVAVVFGPPTFLAYQPRISSGHHLLAMAGRLC